MPRRSLAVSLLHNNACFCGENSEREVYSYCINQNFTLYRPELETSVWQTFLSGPTGSQVQCEPVRRCGHFNRCTYLQLGRPSFASRSAGIICSMGLTRCWSIPSGFGYVAPSVTQDLCVSQPRVRAVKLPFHPVPVCFSL